MSETCRVSFQNKIEKLVHLVDFVIRTFHDDRSHEPKKHRHVSKCLQSSTRLQSQATFLFYDSISCLEDFSCMKEETAAFVYMLTLVGLDTLL